MLELKVGMHKLNHQNCVSFSDLNAFIPLIHKKLQSQSK